MPGQEAGRRRALPTFNCSGSRRCAGGGRCGGEEGTAPSGAGPPRCSFCVSHRAPGGQQRDAPAPRGWLAAPEAGALLDRAHRLPAWLGRRLLPLLPQTWEQAAELAQASRKGGPKWTQSHQTVWATPGPGNGTGCEQPPSRLQLPRSALRWGWGNPRGSPRPCGWVTGAWGCPALRDDHTVLAPARRRCVQPCGASSGVH